jgi:Flp pilus assembly protein TadG
MKPLPYSLQLRQRGAATIEFALVSAIGGLFIVLIGALELGRAMFYLNTAAEVTRLGARMAIVCDANDQSIKTSMSNMLKLLKPENIAVDYIPQGCASSADSARNTCQSVSVSINPGVKVDLVIPFLPISFELPAFTTTLPREAMNTTSCTA